MTESSPSTPADDPQQAHDLPPGSLPLTPRPITRRVRRQTWTETRVRVWWLLALATLVVLSGVFSSEYYAWSQVRWLIRNGTPVQATLVGYSETLRDPAKRAGTEGKRVYYPHLPIYFDYAFNGVVYFEQHPLPADEHGHLTGERLTIRVDPRDPTHFTPETEVPPFLQRIFALFLLAPLAPLFLLIAWISRLRLIKVWVHGQAVQAVVMETRQAPLSPLSRRCLCALADYGLRQRVMIDVVIPYAVGVPAIGQGLWLILPVMASSPALAAKLYE